MEILLNSYETFVISQFLDILWKCLRFFKNFEISLNPLKSLGILLNSLTYIRIEIPWNLVRICWKFIKSHGITRNPLKSVEILRIILYSFIRFQEIPWNPLKSYEIFRIIFVFFWNPLKSLKLNLFKPPEIPRNAIQLFVIPLCRLNFVVFYVIPWNIGLFPARLQLAFGSSPTCLRLAYNSLSIGLWLVQWK